MSYNLSLSAKEIDETLINAKKFFDEGGAVSPVVTITKEDGKATITISDAEGIHTATVFDGEPGPPGPAPVRGDDYWTADDKTEIVNDVLASLPAAEGVSF